MSISLQDEIATTKFSATAGASIALAMAEKKHDLRTVGGRVSWAREKANLTQKQLATAARIKQPTLSMLESGRSRQSRAIPSIARACGVNAVWMETGFGSADDAPPPRQVLDDEDRELMREMGERVARLRERAGITHAQLGRPVLDAQAVRDLEAGVGWPGPMALDVIASKLNTSLDWLVRGMMVDAMKTMEADRDQARTLHDPGPGGFRREV